MSEEQQGQGGKHARKEEEPPQWPGGDNDPGKKLDDWLAESNRKAEGG